MAFNEPRLRACTGSVTGSLHGTRRYKLLTATGSKHPLVFRTGTMNGSIQ